MEPFVQKKNCIGYFILSVICLFGLLGDSDCPPTASSARNVMPRHNGSCRTGAGATSSSRASAPFIPWWPRVAIHAQFSAGRKRCGGSGTGTGMEEEDRDRDHDFQLKHHDRERPASRLEHQLGAGGTSAAMYPAKFSFDVNAAADCTNDFIVYPINAVGSATQPNLVAFNNLYSGTAGGTGICNRGAPPAGDDGVSATTLWSYNIQAAGGQVTTSPCSFPGWNQGGIR